MSRFKGQLSGRDRSSARRLRGLTRQTRFMSLWVLLQGSEKRKVGQKKVRCQKRSWHSEGFIGEGEAMGADTQKRGADIFPILEHSKLN